MRTVTCLPNGFHHKFRRLVVADIQDRMVQGPADQHAAGQIVLIEERPRRRSARIRYARAKSILAALDADLRSMEPTWRSDC